LLWLGRCLVGLRFRSAVDHGVAAAGLGGDTLGEGLGPAEVEEHGRVRGHDLFGGQVDASSIYEGTNFVHDTVFAPLGMSTTVFLHRPPSSESAARGYTALGSPAPGLVPSLVGAGGLWSSPQDLLAFAEGVADADGPLRKAVALATTPRCPTTRADLEQALGFMVRTVGERTLLWHNGAGIGGYAELFAELGAPLAVVLMTNTAIDLGDCVMGALK
jgi:hypothetical protein